MQPSGNDIVARGLSKQFGTFRAVDDFSFTAAQGEITGCIGPDGSGKTTAFRMLATLMKPDAGEASICGYDLVKRYRDIRRIIGYMPGKFSLYQDLSIEENISFFASVYGTGFKESYPLIRDIYIQLEPFKKRRAGALSGGMKQKLALCCALIHKPLVLLLDEPATGVDAVSRREFWDVLIRLKKDGMTILVSTPYMDDAALCDHVILLQQGKIISSGKPAAITERFTHKLFAVACPGKLPAVLRILEGLPGIRSAHAFGQSVHITLHDASANPPELKTLLHEKGIPDARISEIYPNIEDCFMELTETSQNG